MAGRKKQPERPVAVTVRLDQKTYKQLVAAKMDGVMWAQPLAAFIREIIALYLSKA